MQSLGDYDTFWGSHGWKLQNFHWNFYAVYHSFRTISKLISLTIVSHCCKYIWILFELSVLRISSLPLNFYDVYPSFGNASISRVVAILPFPADIRHHSHCLSLPWSIFPDLQLEKNTFFLIKHLGAFYLQVW